MTDRRLLRRYLALVRHAEDLLEASLGECSGPPPAEAVAILEEFVAELEPALRRVRVEPGLEPRDLRLELAGWVH